MRPPPPRTEERYQTEIALLCEKVNDLKLACKQRDRSIKRLKKTFVARQQAIAEDAAAVTQRMLCQLRQRHLEEMAAMRRAFEMQLEEQQQQRRQWRVARDGEVLSLMETRADDEDAA